MYHYWVEQFLRELSIGNSRVAKTFVPRNKILLRRKKKSLVWEILRNSHEEIRLPFSIFVKWQSDLVVRIFVEFPTRDFFLFLVFLGTNVLATRES